MITLESLLKNIDLRKAENEKKYYSPDCWTMETMLEGVKKIGESYDGRFVIDNDNREMYSALVMWFMYDARGKAVNPITNAVVPMNLQRGIFLSGNVGTGKSVAMKVLSRLYFKNPYKRDGLMLRWEEARADEICESVARTGDLSEWKNAPLLCVQDLGSEPTEVMYMGNRLEPLKSIIESRGDRPELVTMFTSNLPLGGSEIVKKYGNRAASRLVEMCNYIVLLGKDRRRML